MQRILIIILIILLSHCSFDNKSGIWQNEQNLSKKDERFKDFKKVLHTTRSYNKIKKPNNSLKIEIAALYQILFGQMNITKIQIT